MTRTALAALLYAAIALFANPAAADLSEQDLAGLNEMRTGQMAKLVFHNAPRDPVTAEFLDEAGEATSFAAFAGKIAVVNFWATWCPPCREEMPGLDRLHAQISGPDFAVAAINIERRALRKSARFYKQTGLNSLPIHADDNRAVSGALGVLGLPVTIILDRQGREIARMQGHSEWDTPEALAILNRLSALLPTGVQG